MWWWNPFGAAVFAFTGGPALLFDGTVIGTAGQSQPVDVGFSVVGGPAIDVVNLAPIAGRGAARLGAAPLEGMQHDALPRCRESFGAAAVQRFTRVLVVDDEIVIRLEGAHDSARSALITYWMAAGTEPDDDHTDYAEAIKFGALFDSYKDTYLIVAQKAVGVELGED